MPGRAPDGTLSTLQLIPPPNVAQRLKAAGKPGKLNLPGCRVEGWFTVGKIEKGNTVYIVEGIGQAWAVWQATGAAAVVTFGAGNMGKVATALRQMDDTARLVLVPDRGKEDDSRRIATEFNCAVAAMPEGEPDNFDVNDLMARDGFDVVCALLESATMPAAQARTQGSPAGAIRGHWRFTEAAALGDTWLHWAWRDRYRWSAWRGQDDRTAAAGTDRSRTAW